MISFCDFYISTYFFVKFMKFIKNVAEDETCLFDRIIIVVFSSIRRIANCAKFKRFEFVFKVGYGLTNKFLFAFLVYSDRVFRT